MHFFADFDNQTKLMHVGYSILGMLISLLVLVKLKPTVIPRMVTAVVLAIILVYCLSTPSGGDLAKSKTLYGFGWFAFGLLFGIGRGEFIIEWLTVKMFGSPTEALAKKEAEEQARRSPAAIEAEIDEVAEIAALAEKSEEKSIEKLNQDGK